MRALLKRLQVIQTSKKFPKAYRINPYNPLSYITIIVLLIVALVCFGAVGMWKELDLRNPFKWVKIN